MDEIRDPQFKTADGSALRIWRDTAKNNFLCEREGRPIFDEVIYVEVISPGSRDSTPVFEVKRVFAPEANRDDEPLFGPKYAEYKDFVVAFEKSEDVDASLAGTPLGQWPEMTRTMVASLKAQNIFTVDALAKLPDTKLSIVGPDGRSWREKAVAYINSAKDGAYATELAAQLETSRVEKEALQEQLAAMASRVQALEDAAGGKPGKPAKAAPVPAPAAAPAPEVDPITGEPLVPAAPII